MPLLKKIGPYEFRFFSRGEQDERPHVHIKRGRLEAKFWLTPVVALARPSRFKTHELRDIEELVEENKAEFLEMWYVYFG